MSWVRNPAGSIKDSDTPQFHTKYLGITPRTVYRLIDSGQLPAYRFGRVFRLQGREIDAFIDSARIQPGDLRHLYDADEGSDDEDLDDAPEDDSPEADDDTTDTG